MYVDTPAEGHNSRIAGVQHVHRRSFSFFPYNDDIMSGGSVRLNTPLFNVLYSEHTLAECLTYSLMSTMENAGWCGQSEENEANSTSGHTLCAG